MDALSTIKKCFSFVTDISKKLFSPPNAEIVSTNTNLSPQKSHLKNENFNHPTYNFSIPDNKYKQPLHMQINEKSKFIGFDPFIKCKSDPLKPSSAPYSSIRPKYHQLFSKQAYKNQQNKQIILNRQTKDRMMPVSKIANSQNNQLAKLKFKKIEEQRNYNQIQRNLNLNRKKIQPLNRNSPPLNSLKNNHQLKNGKAVNSLTNKKENIEQFNLENQEQIQEKQIENKMLNNQLDNEMSKKQKKKIKKEVKQSPLVSMESINNQVEPIPTNFSDEQLQISPESIPFRYQDGDDISSISQRSETTDQIEPELLVFLHKKNPNRYKIQQRQINDIIIPNMKKKSNHQQGQTISNDNNKCDENRNHINYVSPKISQISQEGNKMIKPQFKKKKTQYQLYPGQTIQQFQKRILKRYNSHQSYSDTQNNNNSNLQISDSDQFMNWGTKKLIKHEQYERILSQLNSSQHSIMDEEKQRENQASLLLIQRMIDESDGFSQIQQILNRQYFEGSVNHPV